MKIRAFGVEEWMNAYELEAVYNLAETCVDSLSVEELLALSGRKDELLKEMMGLRLSYGDIPGSDGLRSLIAGLYESQKLENVMVMNGGAAANFLSLYSLVEPGDEVISVAPTYQQLYSIPESFGAKVKILPLRQEKGFLPDPEELRGMVTDRTKLICLNNPNNPTGALMDGELLETIVGIARDHDAWIHCDEIYRGLVHESGRSVPSIADLYEKGIGTGSMSKVFSLAGLRVGWITAPEGFIAQCYSHRDYTTISCGRLDDLLARTALENRSPLLERNLEIVRQGAARLDAWVRKEARVDYVRPSAGTTAFLRYDYDIASEDFCKRLFRRDGTLLVPGSCFDMEHWLRIGYAFDPEQLGTGLANMSAFLRVLEEEGL